MGWKRSPRGDLSSDNRGRFSGEPGCRTGLGPRFCCAPANSRLKLQLWQILEPEA